MHCVDYPWFVHISNVLDLLELEYGKVADCKYLYIFYIT